MATGTPEASGGMPQLDFSTFPNQIFWLVVTLVVIYFLMSRIALPRIATVLAERQDAIQRDLDQAEEMKRKAQEAEVAYNQSLAEAREKAAEIVAQTKADIQADLDKAIAKADAEIAAKAAESEKSIQAIRDNAVKSVEEVATTTAQDLIDAVAPGMGDAKSIKSAVKQQVKG